MRTYVKMLFSSEGARPSAINDMLADMGLEPTTGPHDWYFEWPEKVTVLEVLSFGDKLQAALGGTKCMFELETI